MSRLSISAAWDETRGFVAREGRLILPLVLALLFLPAVVAGLAAPAGRTGRTSASQIYLALFLIEMLVGAIGQLAIARLALGHRERIGDSIGHAVRRLPVYVAAAMLFVFPLSLLFAVAMNVAAGAARDASPARALMVLILVAVLVAGVIALTARALLNTAITAVEGGGPLDIIKRGFALTRGHVLRLLGAAALFLIGGGITVFAVTAAVGSVARLLLGPPQAWTVSALLIALAGAACQAALGAVFTIFFARVYAQRMLAAHVPNSGT